MPLRITFTDDGLTGWRLEIGPYDVEGRDACTLANMLLEYGRLSGDSCPGCQVPGTVAGNRAAARRPL